MMRDMIDEYLDGALESAARADLERTLAADPAAAGLLKAMKAERATRAAAFASYAPAATEASAFAAQLLQACADDAAAPIAHIGPRHWTRWVAGVAAALIVAAAAFSAGRMSAGPQVVVQEKLVPIEKNTYVVTTVDSRGGLSVAISPHLTDPKEGEDFIRQHLPANNSTAVADADYIRPGHL
jgi:anti-sigma-K factor RskA